MLQYVVILCCCFAMANGVGFHQVTYTARLSGPQVAPSSGDEKYVGTAVCLFGRSTYPRYIDCEVSHTIPPNTVFNLFPNGTANENITAFIGVGSRGVEGAVLFTFPGSPLGSNFRYAFTLADTILDGVFYSADQQASDFLNGKWYIQINNFVRPFGNIRGQILHADNFYARMATWGVRPLVQGSNRGIAVGTYSRYTPAMTIEVSISHNVVDANSAFYGRGPQQDVGDFNLLLTGTLQPINEEFKIIKRWEGLMYEEETYFQVNSASGPHYSIRGQIIMIDYPFQVAFTARLNGLNVIPPTQSDSVGCALFTYNCDSKILEYFVVHNVYQPLAAAAWIGTDPIFDLTSSESPIYGAQKLTPKQEFDLYGGNMYIQISSRTYPAADIRGPISTEYQWYAYFTGAQVVPPVTTENVGCGTFRLWDEGKSWDYQILHTLTDNSILELELWNGFPGELGILNRAISATSSPIINDQASFDDDDVQKLQRGELFWILRSGQHIVQPELRGQIYRIAPCHVGGPAPLYITDYTPSTIINTVEDDEVPDAASSMMISYLLFIVTLLSLLLH